MSRDEVIFHLRTLVGATDLPINADFENGFADDPDGVAVNVRLALDTGVAAVSIEDWSGSHIYGLNHAIERIAAARAAIDAVDSNGMLIGRHEHFRCPETSVEQSIGRAVAYAHAGADCVFVPMMLDPIAVAELVAAVAPKPVNVVVHEFDDTLQKLARLGVRRCSVGGSLAKVAWTAFDEVACRLRQME